MDSELKKAVEEVVGVAADLKLDLGGYKRQKS